MEEVDEEGTEGPTFTYLSENGMGEVSILRGDYTSMIGEISADPVAFLGDGMGFESLEITGEHNRTLDGSPLWTLEFTCMVSGQAATETLKTAHYRISPGLLGQIKLIGFANSG